MLLLTAGVVVDDFRIVRPIGQGGMGAVYLAEQLSTGKRRALKIMRPDIADHAEARERFTQEARVGALIGSEHIVDVVSAGIDERTGLPWLAMELLDGADLAAYVRSRHAPLGRREAREILAPLFEGTAAAHAASVVHRDLKPENVFLARRGRGGVAVKILDFGIAKLVRADATTTASIGTPLWAAPEQSDSRAGVSAATDVWALGLIAFYVLAGLPYWQKTHSTMELLREVLVEPLVPASERARALGVDVAFPEGFDAWFARCVARAPDARHPDAGRAWAELAPLLAHRPGDPEVGVVLPADLTTSADATTLMAGAASPYDPTIAADATAPAPVRSGLATPLRSNEVGLPAQSGDVARPPAARGARRPLVFVVLALACAGVGAAVALSARRASTPGAEPGAAASVAHPRDAVSGAMVHFSGGTFQIGSNDDGWRGPRHGIVVPPFWLDRTEVTARAYRACFAEGACPAPMKTSDTAATFDDTAHGDLPINFVNWSAALEFCRWADKRLPSEEEWEFAAAGGTAQRPFPWGAAQPGDGICWRHTLADPPCAVASSPADKTPEGVFDLGGNLREWTSSRFCFYSEPNCAPDGGMQSRTARGANYTDKTAALLQVTVRMPTPDFGASFSIGFRCAR